MNKIDYDSVVSTLNDLVAEKGEDYVYPAVNGECVYSDAQGAPSCIVGHVLARLAPAEFDIIKAKEWPEDSVPVIASFNGIKRVYGVNLKMADKVASLLQEVQNEQDNLATWGYAVAESIKRVNRK